MIRGEAHTVRVVGFYPPGTEGLHWQARCRDCDWRGDAHHRRPGGLGSHPQEGRRRARADGDAHGLYPNGVHVITRLLP